jgi:hypothetical protein
MKNQEYRIHVTLRHQGKPVHTSLELKTEQYDTLDDLTEAIQDFIEGEMDYDLQQIEDGGEE